MDFNFSPKNSVKVISNSTTYYPLNTRNEEGLTLINSNAFLFQNFGENVNSFHAGDKLVVLKMWNGILFSIVSEENYSEEALGFLLKIIKDTAIFLLGAHFENFMSKNIVAAFRELYARYIELFFELCVKDYKFLLMLPPYYKNFPDITDKIPVQPLFEPIQSDQGKLIIEFIVFRDHQIVACYTNPSASPLEPGDVFQISLFERMETRTTTFDENAPIEEPTADSIVHRGGNVHFDHNVERCFLSKIQYGKSPYVLIFVTKEEKPTPELTHKIHTVSKDFCAKLNRYLSDKHKPKPSIYMTGIVHYILVNRSNGTYREPENIDPPKSNNDIEARQYYLCEKIKRNMVSFGLKAFQSRYIAALRNEIHFQYTYEIVVRNTKGQNVVLDKSVLSKYNSSGETESYTKFIKYLQGKLNDNGVEVYELYTAYLGVMPAKDVIKANAMLLDKIIEGKHKNKQ